MIMDIFQQLEGAYANNTIKAYKADFTHYQRWCQKNHQEPESVCAAVFVKYLNEMSQELTSATIQRRIASLSQIFKLTSVPNITKEPEVLLELKKINRRLGRSQKQATPLTLEVMRKLQAVCDDSIVGLRNRLLLQLGYESMRRRSEICAFKFDDVKTLPNGKHALLLRKSKTDQFGEGKLIPISDELVEMINHWQESIKQTDGYILRSFKRNLSIRESLNPAALNKILKFLQRKAKLQKIGELSGHSFRVGAAVDLLDKGVPLERIMLRGGWKSENTALRYLRNWDDSDWLIVDNYY